MEAALRGLEVDPLSRTLRLHLSVTFTRARRWDEAIEIAIETLERYPDYSRIRHPLAEGYLATGRLDEALQQYDVLIGLSRETDNLTGLAVAHALAGHEDEASALLDELSAQGGQPWNIATVQTALGEIDAAFTWLERAIDANQGPLADLLVEPGLDPLRSDSRWPEALSRAGFSEELVSRAGPRN